MTAGRPTLYSKEFATKICVTIATEQLGLKTLHKKYPWFPDDTTIYAWAFEKEEFSRMFNEAIKHRTDMSALNATEEASHYEEEDYYYDSAGRKRLDPAKVAAKKLVLDTVKWVGVKLLPQKYGDRIEQTHKIDKLEDWLDQIKEVK